jgi:mannose-6-phosphate isomerase-like protein (cupin superfamily)
MFTFEIAALVITFLTVAWLTAFIADRLRPEPPAPEFLYPSVGQVIQSRAEGFASQVIKTDDEYVWIETRLAPHAPGPPPHIHRKFAENFYVASGSLSVRLGDEIKTVHAGETFLVSPGVAHQPFNDTDEEVVLRGPLTAEYALPKDFLLFLTQIYGFVDESPAHAKPPAILLQMSLFSPRYDAWLTDPPVFVQRVQSMILRPIARMLGYRSYYNRYVPA